MTDSTLKEIVHRAVRDGAYRAQLQNDPANALAGFSLTTEERAAITSGDPTKLTALGVDRRMSKAFAAGVIGDASKVITIDPGAGGGTVLDEATAAGGMSPVWRVERDLDTAGGAASPEATFDATGLRPVESGSDAAAIDQPAASGMSPVWRVERELDADSASSPEAAFDATGLRSAESASNVEAITGTPSVPSHLQMIEQDLDTGGDVTRADDTSGTDVTPDLNFGDSTPTEY